MTAVADARTALYDALRAELSAELGAWRVHRTTPGQVAAPAVWLDSVELGVDTGTGSGIVSATFPVVVVHDGAVRAQVEELDDLLAHVWTAALTAGVPTDSRPVALDVGGPSLRAHVVRVSVSVLAYSLCAPSLVTAGGS